MVSRFLVRAAPAWPAALATLLFCTTGVSAQDRCEGTLCDLYYGHLAGPQEKQPAAPTSPPPAKQGQVVTVPSGDSLLGRLFGGSPSPQQPATGAPPARRPLVAVQGGGLVGMMQGEAPKRCSGTLCDLYYGGPPPEEPEARPAPAATPVAEQPEEQPAEETPRRSRHMRTAAPPDEQPSCVASAGDPWRCYR